MDQRETHQNKPVTQANAQFWFFEVSDWMAKTQNKRLKKNVFSIIWSQRLVCLQFL